MIRAMQMRLILQHRPFSGRIFAFRLSSSCRCAILVACSTSSSTESTIRKTPLHDAACGQAFLTSDRIRYLGTVLYMSLALSFLEKGISWNDPIPRPAHSSLLLAYGYFITHA